MEKYKQLSLVERSLIQSQLTLGFKPSWIALSTIHRGSGHHPLSLHKFSHTGGAIKVLPLGDAWKLFDLKLTK